MSIQKQLKELTEEKVISSEVAQSISEYYQRKSNNQQNRILVIFSVLGAILIGLGLILMVAHNWDTFDRRIKTLFSFLPLIIGQLFCFYTLLKKDENLSWSEASASFTFFSIGACTALISQVYHIEGDMATFLLSWLIPAIPLFYIMKSQTVALLYISGVTWFACSAGYDSNSSQIVFLYWALIAVILPMYFLTYRKNPQHNILIFYHWFLPLSVVICLGTIEESLNTSFVLLYVFLFAILSLIGDSNWIKNRHTSANGYLVLGSLGSHLLFFPFSFSEVWEEMRRNKIDIDSIAIPESVGLILLFLTACFLLLRHRKTVVLSKMRPTSWLFLAFSIIYIVGLTSSIAVVLTNLLILASGIITIRQGAQQNHLGILNYGLMVITVLILCRFFDTDLSFIVRGILFILVGTGFFIANYFMIKKRKKHEA